MTLRTLLPLMAALLGGCSSVLMTSDGASPGDNLMYAGTRFNAKVIGQDSCEQSGYNAGYSCAYQQLLTPLCLIDFVPSLALDTLLLPFTGLHAAISPSEPPDEQPAESARP